MTIGCSGAFAPAGYSPLRERSLAERAPSSATFAVRVSRALCDMTTHAASRDPLVLAIVNARVWTGDAARPWADAVLIRDAFVVAVGGSAELRKRAGRTARVIDARGMLVLPRDADASLIAGAPADLVVVDRARSDERRFPVDDAEVVLALEAGHIVVERGALAR